MEDHNSNSSELESISGNSKTSRPTLQIFQQFQELYNKQMKTTDDSHEGLKLKIKILQSWVQDLTEQNVMLVKTVGELEEEALKHLSSTEANMPQKVQAPKSLSSTDMLTSQGISQVDSLCGQLEEIKQRLSDKEFLVAKYQSRIEELRASIEKDKTENDKQYLHQYSMTESMMDPHLAKSTQEQSCTRKELELTQKQLSHMENEVLELKQKLKEADSNVKRLRNDLISSEKNAREMRSALTAEVAEKHDQILAFRRELAQLEEQLRQADMQTHFKDDIIKELRKEVKVARSKETLVEVLGIKERSLTHLEQLTEQLEQKERIISCLQSQLQSSADPGNTLYRVRQQVDWFMENVTQQCNQTSVPEEFKKCITTMLEELRESIECCNFGPSSPTEPCKDSIQLISALQKSFDHSKKGLGQSWTSIWETAHQVNKVELSQHVEQWKKCLVKQQCLQLKIQELVQSTIQVLSSSKCNAGIMMDSINSLHQKLEWIEKELSSQRNCKRDASWRGNLHGLVTESITKIEEISKVAKALRRDEESVLAALDCRVQALDCLVTELSEAINVELKAYEKLHRVEKSQRMKLDTLLASVLHYNELWTQQMSVSDDMKREILGLLSNLKQNINKPGGKKPAVPLSPIEQRSLHVKSLVNQISTDIRSSISDIEHRQNQVSNLEVDLSSVRVVMESAQQEIRDIVKECRTQDITPKLMSLLSKLKKEIKNSLTKANQLVNTYNKTKQDYISSSKRILKIQQELDSLEEELHDFHYYICSDFRKPSKPSRCDKKICPIQAELENFQAKVGKLNETMDSYFQQHQLVKNPVNRSEKHISNPYQEMQKVLLEKDAAIKVMESNVMELNINLSERDKLTANQDETIQVLQNSLKICQKEVEDLHHKVASLETKNSRIEHEYKTQIQEYQKKITELRNSLKQSEDAALNLKGGVGVVCKMMFAELKTQYLQLLGEAREEKASVRSLQDANLELATLAGHQQESCRTSENRLAEAYKHAIVSERKHQKSEAALQLVIANLQEKISKDHRKINELQNENKKLQEEFSNMSASYKVELENQTLNEINSNKENQSKIDELKRQAKCWAMKVDDIEAQMKTNEEKLSSSARHEKELQHELRVKESQFKEELSEKQKEVNKLSNMFKSLTDTLKETTATKEAERTKRCEAEQKLQIVCEEMEVKVLEKESAVEKLQSALTQLSNKLVSRRMDNKDCVRHYQEECAKFEALYNSTACKLHSKEDEVSSLMQEIDRLKNELDGHILAPIHERDEEESCPFLLGRVQQLSKELQMAQSYRNSYESLLKELTEKCKKKEEETIQLKAQLKQLTLQRDKLLADLERAQQEIIKLKFENSDLNSSMKKTEIGKAQLTDQMRTMKRLLCDSQVAVPSGGHSVNIEVQREISSALSSQLRVVKQKLHSTRHDYKSLQSAYEELKEKYSLLQKGERDLGHVLESKHLHCTPCGAKSSKSLAHIAYSEELKDKVPTMKYTPSKSWHKMEASYDPVRREKKCKQKHREVMQEDFISEAMNHSSSSN